MRLLTRCLAGIAFVCVLAASAPEVMAGAQDIGTLASCEIGTAQGIPIIGNASVTIDLITNLAPTAFQTWSFTRGFIVIRVLVGPDIGVSPMEYVCEVLNGATAEGGPTLAEQILAAVGLPNQVIKITKKGIFGCINPDGTQCEKHGLHPDFAVIPGSAEIGAPYTSALGTVILYAVRP